MLRDSTMLSVKEETTPPPPPPPQKDTSKERASCTLFLWMARRRGRFCGVKKTTEPTHLSTKSELRCRPRRRRRWGIAIAALLLLVALVVANRVLAAYFGRVWCAPLPCQRCRTAAHRSTSTNDRPCCHDVLFNMLVDLDAFFTSEGFEYYLTFGTLLGAARDGDVIPQTADVDLTVRNTEWREVRAAMKRWTREQRWGPDRTYEFFYAGSSVRADPIKVGVARICATHASVPPREFYRSYMDDDAGDFSYADVYAHSFENLMYMRELVDPLQKGGTAGVCMRGHRFPAPCKTKWYLERIYGTGWTVPDHRIHGNSEAYPVNDQIDVNLPERLKRRAYVRALDAYVAGFQPWLEKKIHKGALSTTPLSFWSAAALNKPHSWSSCDEFECRVEDQASANAAQQQPKPPPSPRMVRK